MNDGRYRICDTALISEDDTKIIIQSHLRIVRVLKPNIISQYLLMYLLNHKIVKRQIETKIFIQSTIAILGSRLGEIILPIPKDKIAKEKIEMKFKRIFELRSELRDETRNLMNDSID